MHSQMRPLSVRVARGRLQTRVLVVGAGRGGAQGAARRLLRVDLAGLVPQQAESGDGPPCHNSARLSLLAPRKPRRQPHQQPPSNGCIPTARCRQLVAAQLTHTMRVPPFTQVLGHEDTMACRRGESAPLARLRDALELPSSTELMLVTDDAAALRAAKAARSYSCYYYRRLPGRPSRLPTDFHADHMSGVKHAVEDLNGVTFRDPSTEIRTEYGVSTT